MRFNYRKICQDLLKDLSPKQKEIIFRRFGLETGERETLESIGRDFGITRERVRQIEEDAISRITPKIESCQAIFSYFTNQFNFYGNLKKEDPLLFLLGGEKAKNHVFFLLNLTEPFSRFAENDQYYSFWTTEPRSMAFGKKIINSFQKFLLKKKEPVSLQEISAHQVLGDNLEKEKINRLSLQAFESFLEISKTIQKNQDNLFGLKSWPEINPRGVKDKAYLAFKKSGKPLHFREVTKLIGDGALSQTVHNELIKDPRFVLIGRGIYALSEWGYQPGQVKDIILKVLSENKKPLTKKEIIEKVMEQRMVKKNTVLLNLNNREYFSSDSKGRYQIRET